MGAIVVSDWVHKCFNTITGIILDENPEMKIQIGNRQVCLNNLSNDDAKYLIKEFSDAEGVALIHYKNGYIKVPVQDLTRELLKIINSCTIFLSYSWKDEKLANSIEDTYKSTNINIIRDKNSIEYWGSIRKYMKSINDTDYVILLISDSFLKSVNCMYEINELLKHENYYNRIFPIVIENSIYTIEGRINYITYWEERYNELNESAKRIKNLENISHISSDLKLVKEISYSIGEFLEIISDKNNPDENRFYSGLLYSLLHKDYIQY